MSAGDGDTMPGLDWCSITAQSRRRAGRVRSDLVQLVNLEAPLIPQESLAELSHQLSPVERAVSLTSLRLTTDTTLCMTTHRLLVVDGLRGRNCRFVMRDPYINFNVRSGFTGAVAQFVSGSGALEVKGIRSEQLTPLQSFFMAGDRDPALLKPPPVTATSGGRRLLEAAAEYRETLLHVLYRHGLIEDFVVLMNTLPNLHLIDEHAVRLYLAQSLLAEIKAAGLDAAEHERTFGHYSVDWFLVSWGREPGFFDLFESAIAEVATEARAELADVHDKTVSLVREADPVDAEELEILRQSFLREVYVARNLPIPARLSDPQRGHEAAPPKAPTAPSGTPANMTQQLLDLRKLVVEGFLSETEFTQAKARLLVG